MKCLLAGQAVYGFGERFDALNQEGLARENHVYETFTNQGASTYLPIPFALTDGGGGLYVDTLEKFTVFTEKKPMKESSLPFRTNTMCGHLLGSP